MADLGPAGAASAPPLPGPVPEASGRLVAVADRHPVVIVGGGINGCGLFRELCLQGVPALLVEKGDYCSGASAAPSRLIHGGIKYLETGEFRLVRQSLLERNLLLRNAPHYAKPLLTVLPIRSWLGGIGPSALRFLGRPARMSDRGALITELGLRMYDLFGRHHRATPRHAFWTRAKALAEMPDLDPAIVAAGLYYEGRVTHAERLGLELVLDGLAAEPGSRALNHVAAEAAEADGALVLRDLLTGEARRVRAEVVVNAGGAWIDKVNRGLGIASSHMGGTKGSHLVVRNPALEAALRGRMVYFGSADGRVNLLYPFMGNVLVGSTDIPVDDPDEADWTEAEADYLLGTVAEVFPKIPVTRDQVVYAYCGVRPLPRSDAEDPGAVSRDHSIAEDRLPDGGGGVPVLSLIGGKWTTFRGFAEEAADLVLGRLGRARRCGTATLPIGGGKGYPAPAERPAYLARLATEHGLAPGRAETLFERYGTAASAVAGWCRARGDRPLATLPDYGTAEIGRIVALEHVGRLDDVLLRRTDVALSGRLGAEVVREVAAVVAEAAGWSGERSREEIGRADAIAARRAGGGPPRRAAARAPAREDAT